AMVHRIKDDEVDVVDATLMEKFHTGTDFDRKTLGATLGFDKIEVGGYIETEHYGRHLRIWRMPSSSRAFPRSIEWKADYYRRLLDVATASAPM
ncbi:MAG: hypothetical protein K2L93_02565, partial [Muribaculaceae bacterium]|nr:hypothetical protein [Muribaculaceae bacterium]